MEQPKALCSKAPVWITGGMGFIGSHLVQRLLATNKVLNLDSLTYAASFRTCELFDGHAGHEFSHASILDGEVIRKALERTQPDFIFHLAAESHVDRSISSPAVFIETNVLGTQVLLDAVTDYWNSLSVDRQNSFRFIQVSTDEVYGQLSAKDAPFTENSPYQPRSNYAASKAASDHLVSAHVATHGLPAIITHCSNNFGSRQHSEKFIPTIIRSAIADQPIPIYGSGLQQRDWLAVEDHVDGLIATAKFGNVGEHYLFGADCELSNLALAEQVCQILDQQKPRSDGKSYSAQIAHISDRPGHDFRYAVDTSKAQKKLSWSAQRTFFEALNATISWYLKHPNWHAG